MKAKRANAQQALPKPLIPDTMECEAPMLVPETTCGLRQCHAHPVMQRRAVTARMKAQIGQQFCMVESLEGRDLEPEKLILHRIEIERDDLLCPGQQHVERTGSTAGKTKKAARVMTQRGQLGSAVLIR